MKIFRSSSNLKLDVNKLQVLNRAKAFLLFLFFFFRLDVSFCPILIYFESGVPRAGLGKGALSTERRSTPSEKRSLRPPACGEPLGVLMTLGASTSLRIYSIFPEAREG